MFLFYQLFSNFDNEQFFTKVKFLFVIYFYIKFIKTKIILSIWILNFLINLGIKKIWIYIREFQNYKSNFIFVILNSYFFQKIQLKSWQNSFFKIFTKMPCKKKLDWKDLVSNYFKYTFSICLSYLLEYSLYFIYLKL